MDRRKRLLRESKNALKNSAKREDKRAYKILIFSMIVSVLNWIFWHDQFLRLDLKYNLLFIVLPMVLGILFYFYISRKFIKDIMQTESSGLLDTIFSYVFLFVISLFFAYFTMVTLSNIVFKLTMDFYTAKQPTITKTFDVESTYNNYTKKGFHFFSSVRYRDEANELQFFDVPLDAVETSREKRTITFDCKQGFWGYYKIIDYNIK